MFDSVLLDGDMVVVDKYVQSLDRDLRKAMALAQKHIKKQHSRQAEVYNRQVKGHSVEKDDRVLVANKGEQGNYLFYFIIYFVGVMVLLKCGSKLISLSCIATNPGVVGLGGLYVFKEKLVSPIALR